MSPSLGIECKSEQELERQLTLAAMRIRALGGRVTRVIEGPSGTTATVSYQLPREVRRAGHTRRRPSGTFALR